MSKDLNRFVSVLLKTRALRLGSYKLPDGTVKPYFVDMKPMLGTPSAFQLLVQKMEELIIKHKLVKRHDYFCSTPTAGLALTSVLSFKLKKPMVSVLKMGDKETRVAHLDGIILPGSRVLIVDDVLMTGRSIKSMAEGIRASGGIVDKATVILDREENGRDLLRRYGVDIVSYTRFSEISRALKRYTLGEDQAVLDIMSRSVEEQ